MYLIKVSVHMRDAYRLLADCQKMHQFVTSLFDTDRSTSQVLYRTKADGEFLHIYIYANRPADTSRCKHKIEQKEITAWLNAMETGQYLGFDLVASPCKKVLDGGKNSKRKILRTEQERQAWLSKKAEASGFTIVQATEQSAISTAGKHPSENGGKMHHNAYHYQGVLHITNAELFRRAIQDGIGPGKAYGFGMMMVKPL